MFGITLEIKAINHVNRFTRQVEQCKLAFHSSLLNANPPCSSVNEASWLTGSLTGEYFVNRLVPFCTTNSVGTYIRR